MNWSKGAESLGASFPQKWPRFIPILVILLLFFIFSPSSGPREKKGENFEEKGSSRPQKLVSSSPSPTKIKTKKDLIKVVRVIDGDTIEIEGGTRVRYIGIDAPEFFADKKECFAVAATDKNIALVQGQMVRLEKDISEKDKYDRLLRYVWRDQVLVNEELVRQGFARVWSYPPDVKYQERFLRAEQQAREEERGLWKECGRDSSAAATTKVLSSLKNNSSPTPSSSPSPSPLPTPTPLATLRLISPTAEKKTVVKKETEKGKKCQYDCQGPDRDCSDFATHAAAVEFWNCCGFSKTNDPMRLDSIGIGDGDPCESLP